MSYGRTGAKPVHRGVLGVVVSAVLPAALTLVIAAAPAGAATGSTAAPVSAGGTSPTAPTSSLLGGPLGSLGAKTLKAGMRGIHVKRLQTWLSALGYRISVDGQFGPGTKRVVKRFQREHKLRVTGRVDRRTGRALIRALVVPAVTLTPSGDVRGKIVSAAASQLGVGETPRGSNCTPYGPCEAWCADFATWVWRQAGVPGIGRIAWVPDLVTWGKRHGSWKPGYDNDPQPGDMVIFSGQHVGLVERVLPSGAISIIAGNTGTNNVARRGPASPANGTAMGPAAISGYVSPVAVTAVPPAAASQALRAPTPAQMAAQDPQDHDAALAAREQRQLDARPALQHLPATVSGVHVDFTNTTRDGRVVLTVTYRGSRGHATATLRSLLSRYRDSGDGYVVRYRAAR